MSPNYRLVGLVVKRGCIAGILIAGVAALAQTGSGLPEPQQSRTSSQASAQADGASSSSAAASSISGTVTDGSGSVIQGATVDLKEAGVPGTLREIRSGATGQFEFAHLEPGTYTVTVTGKGMTKFVSGPIALQADEPVIVPKVVLGFTAAATTVTVMDKKAASIQQVKIAEQQRVLKVFPNFYSSFDWNAPPMLAKQKYRLATRTLIDPVTFLTTAGVAGAEQNRNIFPSFGGGMEGYAKRYGAAYVNHASGEFLTRAILPSVFHSDPRYFVMGEGSVPARVAHAIGSTFVTRGDNGSRKINFPEMLGDFGSAALSNAYYPAQERGGSLVLINGFGDLGGDILDNLFREFVLNHWTSRARR